jgi:hypothetical protein
VLKKIANALVVLNTQAIKKHVGETKNLAVRDTLQIPPTYLDKQTAEVLKNIANALVILNYRAFEKHVRETNNLVARDTLQIQPTYLYRQTAEVLKSIANSPLTLNGGGTNDFMYGTRLDDT